MRGKEVPIPLHDGRNSKFRTHYPITAINNSKLRFGNLITSTGRLQSQVTVPLIRDLCGAPTNLRILKIRKPFLSDYRLPVYELSWNPPNDGSCQITSFTVFWCSDYDWMSDCKVSDSVLYLKSL